MKFLTWCNVLLNCFPHEHVGEGLSNSMYFLWLWSHEVQQDGSKIAAVRPLQYELYKVYDALEKIADDETLIGLSGTSAWVYAANHGNIIYRFRLVASPIFSYIILHVALELLEHTKKYRKR